MEVQTQSLSLRQAAGFGEGCQLDPQGKVVPEPMQLVKRQLRCSGRCGGGRTCQSRSYLSRSYPEMV